jgi:hypothetical protein
VPVTGSCRIPSKIRLGSQTCHDSHHHSPSGCCSRRHRSRLDVVSPQRKSRPWRRNAPSPRRPLSRARHDPQSRPVLPARHQPRPAQYRFRKSGSLFQTSVPHPSRDLSPALLRRHGCRPGQSPLCRLVRGARLAQGRPSHRANPRGASPLALLLRYRRLHPRPQDQPNRARRTFCSNPEASPRPP